MIRLALFLALVSTSWCANTKPAVTVEEITLDTTVKCDEIKEVAVNGEFKLHATGDVPGSSCAMTFNAAPALNSADCSGLCYMFDLYAFFKNPNASLAIEVGSKKMVYDSNASINSGPVCMSAGSMKIVLTENAGYQYDENEPKEFYGFTLAIFHHCGEKGQVRNTKFEDAIKYAEGYHHSEEREQRERHTFTSGILLGFGLACIFLVVLFVAYCYTRNSPNRGPSRSVGVPKVGGFKKKMKPNEPEHKAVEMGVRYQPQDPDRKPEHDPLLNDPEKPPVDTVPDDEVKETKPVPAETKPENTDVEKGEVTNTTEGSNETNTEANTVEKEAE